MRQRPLLSHSGRSLVSAATAATYGARKSLDPPLCRVYSWVRRQRPSGLYRLRMSVLVRDAFRGQLADVFGAWRAGCEVTGHSRSDPGRGRPLRGPRETVEESGIRPVERRHRTYGSDMTATSAKAAIAAPNELSPDARTPGSRIRPEIGGSCIRGPLRTGRVDQGGVRHPADSVREVLVRARRAGGRCGQRGPGNGTSCQEFSSFPARTGCRRPASSRAG
jgi:hypothetical protein